MTPVWWSWPSWLVELLSGLLVIAVLAGLEALPWWLRVSLLALTASLVYERYVDRNGFQWRDVGQRAVGLAVGLLLWAFLR